MKDVQGWWEVPSICYYCSLLGNAFGLPDFTIERLEEALSAEEEDVLLTEMFTTLTQSLLPEAVDKSWREKVAYLFSDRGKSSPFEKSEFDKTLTCWEKLDILYNLCELRMECADVNGIIKTIEKWQLKTLPIGEDSNEMLYWYFCGTRIYRQDRSVEHLERKSARRSVKRQKSTAAPVLIGMNGLKKYAYETLLKLTDTPRSNLIKEDEGHEHWTVATSSHHETQLFTARFETSTEPEEETLYRNLVKVVLPKIDIVVAEQERKEMLAGERKGLTRSGRKVVARYKNGFVASADQESSDNKSDPSQKEKEDLSKRQSKRRRTQPPSNTPVRRSSRHNSDILSPGKKEKSKERPTPVRATSRTTRRSSKLEEFTEPPSTDTDDEVDENEDEENDKEEEDGAEEEEEPEKKSPTKERAKQVRKPGTTPVRRRGPGRPGVIRPTIRDQIAEALLLRDKDRKGKTKHLPTGEGDPDIVERLSDVMATLTRHPEAWQFNEPVNEDFAPYYYTLIENPKDFNMIERSVIDQQYKNVSEFVDNINLVFTNCYDYNGPINEYTRAARVLEKYFRRLMRELCREDYTFDGHSVIYPGKRLFVNRHKRIKALKLAGVIVLPQKSKPSFQDESSRDSNTSALRSPGGDENSNDGSEKSTVTSTTKPKRRSASRRKKTTDQDQSPVSFTALLSEGGPQHYPAHHHGYPYHPGYPPYYYGYHDPYRAGYHYPPVDNSAPTYIELSPRPMTRKRVPCKNDVEPLLFPHLPKSVLPKPTLTASKIPEDLILRDLAANQPSQINSIDSTTTPPEKKEDEERKEPNKTLSAAEPTREAAPDSTIVANGDKENGEVQSNGQVQANGEPQVNGEVDGVEVSLNNEAVPKKSKDSSEASAKKVETKPATPAVPKTPPPAPKPAEQPVPSPNTAHYQQSYTNGGYYGQQHYHGYYSGYYGQQQQHQQQQQHHPVSYNPHHTYNNVQYNNDPYNQGYHHPPHQGYQYHQQLQPQYHQVAQQPPHPAQYQPSPLLGEQALYVSRSKQITNTGRSRARQPRARSGTPSKRKQAPPSPLSLDVNKDVVNRASKEGTEVDKILPPTPPKETKKQKKVFDIRIPPKKRVRS